MGLAEGLQSCTPVFGGEVAYQGHEEQSQEDSQIEGKLDGPGLRAPRAGSEGVCPSEEMHVGGRRIKDGPTEAALSVPEPACGQAAIRAAIHLQ